MFEINIGFVYFYDKIMKWIHADIYYIYYSRLTVVHRNLFIGSYMTNGHCSVDKS